MSWPLRIDPQFVRHFVPLFAPALILTAAFAAVVLLFLLPSVEHSYRQQRYDLCRRLVESALSDLRARQADVQAGEIAVETAQLRALARLRSLRFGTEGKDYFWIVGPDGRFLMHPYRPDLEGADPGRVLAPDGQPLAVLLAQMESVAAPQGDGMLAYRWHWKDDLDVLVDKVSYVARFQPWHWAVGTGVYTDDMAADLGRLRRTLLAAGIALTALAAAMAVILSWRAVRAERREARAREQLRQAHKLELIGRLAGGVAHDFNNILAAILGHAELASEQLPAGSPLRPSLDAIQTSAERAADLTRKLLTFSRTGRIERVVVDLHQPLCEAMSMLRRSLGGGAAIELLGDLHPQPLLVAGDPTLLQSALLNILINARDAMPDGGVLTVTTAPVERVAGASDGLPLPAGRYARVVIRDTGTGMPPEIQDHAFEPFYTTKPVGKGTGLGLSTVYGTVRDHGGAVTLESRPGVGTTVGILLPRAPAGARAVAPRGPARADASR